MKNKKVLFLTTANLSIKPRLVKEIKEAQKKYEVHLVSFTIGNWSDSNHRNLADQLNIKNIELSATRNNFIQWLIVTSINKISLLLWPLFKKNLLLTTCASNKKSIILLLYILFNREKYCFANGRNNATLYPVYLLKTIKKTPFIFDVEDYHPCENVSWCNSLNEKMRREILMRNILPNSAYITSASPGIEQKTLDLLKSKINHQIILNSFPMGEFLQPTMNAENHKLKFVWFSLEISKSRGLEILLPALYEFKGDIELTLIGDLNQQFYNDFLVEYKELINFKPPMSQKKMHRKLIDFDIGLALELSDIDLNKQLALSNKIYAYTQAGLYILATDTLAQKQFIEEAPERGIVCGQTIVSMKKTLLQMIKNKEKIRANAVKRYNNAKSLAWENERVKLSEIWANIKTNH